MQRKISFKVSMWVWSISYMKTGASLWHVSLYNAAERDADRRDQPLLRLQRYTPSRAIWSDDLATQELPRDWLAEGSGCYGDLMEVMELHPIIHSTGADCWLANNLEDMRGDLHIQTLLLSLKVGESVELRVSQDNCKSCNFSYFG